MSPYGRLTAFGERPKFSLAEALCDAARTGEAFDAGVDAYGRRFMLDFDMENSAGAARIRSHWIIRTGEDAPRLTTCFVLPSTERR